MSERVASVLGRVRKPEYTGENRCLPCAVVNLVIALLASALVALVRIELAAVVLAASLLAIYFRGYLVPGTPELTKRYLPDRVRALFDAHPLEDDEGDEQTWETLEKLEYERENAVDTNEFLLDEGVVTLCEGGDEFRFTDEFEALLAPRKERFRAASRDRSTLATMFETEPDEITFLDREYPALRIDRRIRKWPSTGALILDLATHDALREHTDRWADVPLEQRREIVESLRGMHASCPICSGEISYRDEVVESCCGEYEVTRIGCLSCGEHFLEFDPAAVGSEEDLKGISP